MLALAPAVWFNCDSPSAYTLTDGKISAWLDQSGNGRHATQTTAAKRPTLTAAAVNTRDALLFDGIDDALIATWTAKTDAQTIYAVARNNRTDLSTRRVWAFSAMYSIFANGSLWAFYANDPMNIVNLGGNNTSFSLTELIRASNATATGRINANNTTSFDPFDIAGGTQFTIGCDTPTMNNQFWPGHIAEILGFDRIPTSSETELIRERLMTKYGITPQPIASYRRAND